MRDIDTLLKQADPAAHAAGYSPAQRREILAFAVAAQPSRNRRVWRRAAVAAVTILVVGLAFANLGRGGATAAAAEVLSQAADRAVDKPMRADQYLRITTEGETLYRVGDVSGGVYDSECLVSFAFVEYVAVDGSRPTWFDHAQPQLVRTVRGDECPAEFNGWRWADDDPPNATPGSWQVPNAAFLESLPRDVDQLRDRLYADTDGHGIAHGKHASVHTYVRDVLRSAIVPADLRAALYEVLKTVPGTDVIDTYTINGVDAVAIGITGDKGLSDYILIDPESGAVVGETSEVDGIELVSVVTVDVVDEVPADLQAEAPACIGTCE